MPVNSEIFRIYRHLFYGSPLKIIYSFKCKLRTGTIKIRRTIHFQRFIFQTKIDLMNVRYFNLATIVDHKI